jgi:hypothetical protein
VRIAPRTCSAGSAVCGGVRRQATKTATTPTNEAALARNAQPPDRGDQGAAERRPERLRRGEPGRVQRDGLRQVLAADELGQDRRLRRHAQRRAEPVGRHAAEQ